MKFTKMTALVAGLCLLTLFTATGEEAKQAGLWPGKAGSFHSFTQYDFNLDELKCKVVVPEKVADGKPWVWRARFWGHEPQVDIALLNKGFHIAYVNVAGLFGSPEAVARWDAFYKYLVESHGFDRKAVLEGMSRGGLIVYNWAAKNPEKVHCIYADAPVCDIKSWPGGRGNGPGAKHAWAQCLQAYGMTEAEALAYRNNPIDTAHVLAKAGVPLLHVVGDADQVVPVSENTAVVEKRYKDLGGQIQVIHKQEVGHHPHCLEDPAPIVDFILKNTTRGEVAGADGPDEIDLFIMAGQSNAQGWKGDAAHYPEDPDMLDQEMMMYYVFPAKERVYSSGGKWVHLGPQGGRFEQGHFGPEITFARSLKKAGYNPAIFKYSKGATSLAHNWKGPGDGRMYDRMAAEFDKALSILERQGRRVHIRGFVWIQGESDARTPETANAYKGRLSALIHDFRKNVTKQPELPVILGLDEQHPAVALKPQVIHAQQALAKEDENIVFTSMIGLEKADKTHLTPKGLEAHGQRIATAYLDLAKGHPLTVKDKI